MFKVDKKYVSGALDEFYDSYGSRWEGNLGTMKSVSKDIVDKIYAGSQPEQLLDNDPACIVGAVVYIANNRLSDRGDVERILYDEIVKDYGLCSSSGISRAYHLIEDKIDTITDSDLIDMAFTE